MSDLKDLAAKYKKAVTELNANRELFALQVAKDAHALTANRIQNKGVNAEGQKMKAYSKNLMPFWFLNPSDYPSQAKITKFKKDASKETAKAKKEKRDPDPDKVSYYGLRKAYGLPVDKRTLTFTERMFSSIVQEVEKSTETSTTVIIKANNDTEQAKINFNSAREKTNILALDKNEKQMVEEANRQRVEKLLKAQS